MKTRAQSEEPPHVITTAAINAKVLRDDPVMTAQLKEHMSVEQILRLLDLPKDEVLRFYGIPVASEGGR